MPNPPILPARVHRSTHHGRVLEDPFYWLRAQNWAAVLDDPAQLDPLIASAIEAENRYSAAWLADTVGLQSELVAEMRSRMPEADSDVPWRDGGFAYYWRYRPGAEQPLFARVAVEYESAARAALLLGETPDHEQLLLDCEHEAARYEYFDIAEVEVSPDHRLVAWSADCAGAEKCSLFVRDILSGQDLIDRIESVATLTWLDPQNIVYVALDQQYRARHVRCHQLGTAVDDDRCVYDEPDSAFEVCVGRTRSGTFVEIASGNDSQDEVRLLRTDDPALAPILVQAREPGLEYSIDHYRDADGDRLLILTNCDAAVDFRIMSTPLATPAREHWQERVPHRSQELLLSADCYADWLVWTRRVEGLTRLCWQGPDGVAHEWAPDEGAYELDIELSAEFNQHRIRVYIESPTTPAQIFDFDLQSCEFTLLKQICLPSGHDPASYCTQRLHADSHDGVKVPLTCVYHRDTALDGTAPCVVEVYGSYGSSLSADFCSDRLSLLNRGYVYVLAHVRGGQECGRAWYDAATLQHKPNTFFDTVAVADFLVTTGMASGTALSLVGRSAGGLAVGVVINRWPGRFSCAIADVPFVDVLQTMLDGSLPQTPGEWTEWGNPVTQADDFDTIADYSPYDNVRPQAYPAMLVTAGLTDPRVGYWEPLKWVTRLRTCKSGNSPLLLHTDTGAGHFGPAGRFEALSAQAREYAFILKVDSTAL